MLDFRLKIQQKAPQETLRGLLCIPRLNYSAGTIAPLGQVSQQEPQSRQEPASMT